MTDNVTMTAIDGTDALALRHHPTRRNRGRRRDRSRQPTAWSKPAAAYVLRHVANQWDGGQADESAPP
jgi:hypothetical protein